MVRTLLETQQIVPDFLAHHIPEGDDLKVLKFESENEIGGGFADDADAWGADGDAAAGGWGSAPAGDAGDAGADTAASGGAWGAPAAPEEVSGGGWGAAPDAAAPDAASSGGWGAPPANAW